MRCDNPGNPQCALDVVAGSAGSTVNGYEGRLHYSSEVFGNHQCEGRRRQAIGDVA